LALAGVVGLVALGFALTHRTPSSLPHGADSPSTPVKVSETEPKAPSNELALPEPTATAARAPSAAPAAPETAKANNPSSPAHAARTTSASTKTTSNESKQAAEAAPLAAVKTPSQPKAEPALVGAGFDRAAAASALASAAAQASACRREGDPSGAATVTVTFAPSGRVTAAKLSGPPFAGTATGGCIAATLRRAKIPAFDGDMVTVGKTIVVQ
jgi:hypothetical protein